MWVRPWKSCCCHFFWGTKTSQPWRRIIQPWKIPTSGGNKKWLKHTPLKTSILLTWKLIGSLAQYLQGFVHPMVFWDFLHQQYALKIDAWKMKLLLTWSLMLGRCRFLLEWSLLLGFFLLRSFHWKNGGSRDGGKNGWWLGETKVMKLS